jgi:paraquat-inducible protein A
MVLVEEESAMSVVTGKSLGLGICHRCRQVAQIPDPQAEVDCPTCGAPIHQRKNNSLSYSLAYLIAAYVLYIPANLLPVLKTETILGSENDTIMSGVLVLINSGSWPLGALVFFASIVVPLLKLISLTLLIVTVKTGSQWAPLQRTRLYRLVEFVGRWSMLDIYVVTLLVGLVQIQSLAIIKPGSGALAFGAVVVLSMLSALSFDSRLIWDPIQEHHEGNL